MAARAARFRRRASGWPGTPLFTYTLRRQLLHRQELRRRLKPRDFKLIERQVADLDALRPEAQQFVVKRLISRWADLHNPKGWLGKAIQDQRTRAGSYRGAQ